MGVFRSGEMKYCQITLPKDVAYQCVAELGELELLEFVNINDQPYPMKKFYTHVKMCDEILATLRRIIREIKKEGIEIATPETIPEAPQEDGLMRMEGLGFSSLKLYKKLLEEYNEINERTQRMKEALNKLVEQQIVTYKGNQYLLEAEEKMKGPKPTESVESEGPDDFYKLRVVGGVIDVKKTKVFETLVWRISKGNAYLAYHPFEKDLYDLDAGEQVRKTAFILSYQGGNIGNQIKKLCEGYRITLYKMSNNPDERNKQLQNLKDKIIMAKIALDETKQHRLILLEEAASRVRRWFIEVDKMKAIYVVLNYFDWDSLKQSVIIECWIPQSNIQKVYQVLVTYTRANGSHDPIIEEMRAYHDPPTFMRNNKFTYGFQQLVDAYGIPSYGELNPMPFIIITFPFLFAIMFGDMGHGAVMFIFALFMVIKEKWIEAQNFQDQIITLIFGGRYIILLMGLFSIYTGLIYNDFFSLSIDILGTKWKTSMNPDAVSSSKYFVLNPTLPEYKGYPYELGVDPIWKASENQISFTNSFKMKIAIIFGFFHMLFGILLSVVNYVYFRNYVSIIFGFLPQLLFFVCLIGYFVFLFFFKWIVYDPQKSYQTLPHCAPSLLITYIDMFMFKDRPPEDKHCNREMYPGQKTAQMAIVIIAVICIPWMLIFEPIIEIMKVRKRRKANEDESNYYYDDEEEDDVLSIIVHQCIHTIEFVLGCISYTASYLRLWALSLAHSQLAEVAWHYIFIQSFHIMPSSYLGILIIIPLFILWVIMTLMILVIMEGLSAFLHALRLHWLEFQSKFYAGLGRYFVPFSFKPILIEARIRVQND